MLRKLGPASAFLVLGLAACSGGEDPAVDAGQPPADTGVTPVDTGMPPPDTGVMPPDAGMPDTGPEPDAGDLDAGMPDTGPEPDAGPPPPEAVPVSGRIKALGRYLAGENYYVGNAGVLAYGVNPPPAPVVADAQGNYSVTLPTNGQAILVTNYLQGGYNQSFNAVTTQDEAIVDKNIYAAEGAWLNEIATAHNVDLNGNRPCQTQALAGETCVYSVIVGKILDDGAAGNGVRRPVGGVYRDDFTVTGGANSAPWYTKGPYFLDYTGTSSAAAQQSIVYQNGAGDYLGGLYVIFPEVPLQGPTALPIQVNITYDYNGVNRYFGPASIQTFRSPGGGVSWASIYETGTPPPPPPGGIDFDSQIYPLFLPVNQGGLGCQGCHTNQGGATPAGGMNLYGGAAAAYDSLNPNQYPLRVNTTTPADSYLLTKPLYEADGNQNHAIFAFLTEQDPGYQYIYTWISEGAARMVQQPPVSFYNDIRPMLYQPSANGGAGCYACHGNAANASGGFYTGGDGNALHEQLVNTAPTNPGRYNEPYRINKANYPERSLLLANPLFGDEEAHPVKIFYDTTDPRYQLIYRWVQEGWINDTP